MPIIKYSRLLLGALLGAFTLSANADVPNGTYKGMFNCEKLPWTKGPQHVAIEIVVSDDKAKYSRTIYNWDNSAVVGQESGSGSIGSDGTIRVTGGWHGGRDEYEAVYAGKLNASGGSLRGIQNWTHEGKSYTRECSMTVSR
jgi:hypothetical protein